MLSLNILLGNHNRTEIINPPHFKFLIIVRHCRFNYFLQAKLLFQREGKQAFAALLKFALSKNSHCTSLIFLGAITEAQQSNQGNQSSKTQKVHLQKLWPLATRVTSQGFRGYLRGDTACPWLLNLRAQLMILEMCAHRCPNHPAHSQNLTPAQQGWATAHFMGGHSITHSNLMCARWSFPIFSRKQISISTFTAQQLMRLAGLCKPGFTSLKWRSPHNSQSG